MITVKVEPEVHNKIKKLSLDWGRSVQDTYDILLRNHLWGEAIPEPLEPKKEEPTVRVSREINDAMKSIPKFGNMTNYYTKVMKEIIDELNI